MNAELFSDAMGQVADAYYMEAAVYHAGAAGTRDRRVRRLFVRIAIAAVLFAVLSVTAYAVYQAVLKDYFLDPDPVSTSEPAEAARLLPPSRFSVVGYQGTPEYSALQEWYGWQEQHPSENYPALENDFSNADYDLGDYHTYYNAWFTEQGEALDAILEKYDLAPHRDSAGGSAEDIYRVLGTGSLMPGCDGSGYVYDDGTFNLETTYAAGGIDLTLFVSVKGTLTDTYGYIFSDPDYEEWSFTVPSGETADLILDSRNRGLILYETEGAYVTLFAGHTFPGVDPLTREELETAAGCVDLAALAARFDGSAHPETAAKVAALREERMSAADPGMEEASASSPGEESEEGSVSSLLYADATALLRELGQYTFGILSDRAPDQLLGSETTDTRFGAAVRYESVDCDWQMRDSRAYHLQYTRLDDLELDADEYLDLILKTELYAVGGTVSDSQVNGNAALLWGWGDGCSYSVYWYDAEAKLLFKSSVSTGFDQTGVPVTAEEAIAAAESVTKVS